MYRQQYQIFIQVIQFSPSYNLTIFKLIKLLQFCRLLSCLQLFHDQFNVITKQYSNFDKKAQMSKVKVAYSYKGDMTILQQEIDEAIKKALHELDLQQQRNPNSNYKQLRSITERRLMQFFMNCFSRFRNTVQYSKNQQKNIQKVIMQPDLNIQKLNQVKMSMLRQSILKAERQKWPQLKNKIQISQPQTLQLVHFQGYKQNINESLNRNYQKVVDYSKQIQRIKNIQDSITQAVSKIQLQQRYDSDYLGFN